MKGITTLLIILILWYIAGIFRQTYIMTLAVCIGLLIVVLIVLSIYQKRKLSVTFKTDKTVTFKNAERAVTIRSLNRSRLPVNRYRLTLAMKYTTDKRPVRKKLFGCSAGKSADGNELSDFYIKAPYCGVIDIELIRLRVYDPFSVFYSNKKLRESGKLLVFPAETKINVVTQPYGSFEDLPLTDTPSLKLGDDHSEIRQIREYRPGDLTRYIHRNYSARTDNIWVKEFCKENDRIIDLYLDASTPEASETEGLDAFYELVWSVIASLLDKDVVFSLHWYDNERKQLVSYDVKTRDDLRDAMGRLYLTDKICHTQFASFLPQDRRGTMLINSRLEWFFSDRAVYRFSRQNIKTELASLTFRL